MPRRQRRRKAGQPLRRQIGLTIHRCTVSLLHTMRTLKLTLAYDGTSFHGWQVQPGHPTIQGAVMDVLRGITQDNDLALHGAGRTDAGVHALGQVAHFETEATLTPGEFLRALNSLLPAAIRVVQVEEAPPGFHARHSAVGKTYAYRIFRGNVLPPFLAPYTLHYFGPLNEEAMQQAARLFQGEHDFTTFSGNAELNDAAGDPGASPSPIRTISSSQVVREPVGSFMAPEGEAPGGDLLVYRVSGRSFLRYMVRKITGTLLDVGRGRFKQDEIPRLLALRDRSRISNMMSPHGLFLESVQYPGSQGRASSAELR